MSLTPSSRVTNVVNDELLDEGYDTDGQMGHFYEDQVNEEEFFTMNEDEQV